MKVTKLLIPCAGYGTRFMPATKATPKELFCLADKPVLLYHLIEARKSGITDVLIITSSAKKHAIKTFLTPSKTIEQSMIKAGIGDLLDEYNDVVKNMKISFAIQHKMLGTSDAVRVGRFWAKGQPFCMLFGDDTYSEYEGKPALRELIDLYESLDEKAVIVGGREVGMDEISRYGIIGVTESVNDNVYKFDKILEKPKREEVVKPFAGLGRYIFPPSIFSYIKKTKPSPKGEYLITDAISLMAKDNNAYFIKLPQQYYDMGNKLFALEANVEFALRDPILGPPFMEYLKQKINENQ